MSTITVSNLKNIRCLKAALKDATFYDVEYIIRLIEIIRDKRLSEIEEQKVIQEQHKEKIKNALDYLREYNIDVNELIDINRANTRKKMTYRYRYCDLNGVVREWTGQGKVPVPLRELMASNGTQKEDYLIKD